MTTTLSRQELDFITYLVTECGIRCPRPLGDGRWAGVLRKMFTHAIVIGQMGDRATLADNWCYQDGRAAEAALDAWDGTGEPGGWTRHPGSGRRVSTSPGEHDEAGREVDAVGVAYVRL